MARRQSSTPEGRPHRHVVRLTDEEETDICGRAAAAGVTVSRYLVQAARDNTPSVDMLLVVDLLLGLNRQIVGEATNLNQLARAANEDVWFETEIAQAARTAHDTNTRLTEVLEKLR